MTTNEEARACFRDPEDTMYGPDFCHTHGTIHRNITTALGEPTMTLPALTARDFEMPFDGEHTFPFFENEDAEVFAYGHVDKAELVAKIREYDDLCTDDATTPDVTEVQHIWATVSETPSDGDSEPEWRLRIFGVTESTPDAFPISYVPR